jgi:hypothetical protein
LMIAHTGRAYIGPVRVTSLDKIIHRRDLCRIDQRDRPRRNKGLCGISWVDRPWCDYA